MSDQKNDLLDSIRKAKDILKKYPTYKIETGSELIKVLNTKGTESMKDEVAAFTPWAAFGIPIYIDPLIPSNCFRVVGSDGSVKYYKIENK